MQVNISEKEKAAILYTTVFSELESEHQEFEQISKDLRENRDTLIKLLIRLGVVPHGTTRVTTDLRLRQVPLYTEPSDMSPGIRPQLERLYQG